MDALTMVIVFIMVLSVGMLSLHGTLMWGSALALVTVIGLFAWYMSRGTVEVETDADHDIQSN